MGSIFSRSSSSRSAGTKPKWKKSKQKQLNSMETSTDDDKFIMQNNNERESSNGNLINSYEDWNKRIEQQQMSNINDPPGAPSTYSNNYPHMQNDIMNQSWSSHHDVNNQFYQNYSHPTSNMPYDPHQYGHNHMSNTFINQSQQMLDERPSKKVQFAHPIQQRESSMKAPLTNAQSWHDISPANNDMTNSITRQEPISNRQTIHRSVMPISDPSSSQVSQQKPIYVGIDYKATLAERGQATAPKRHHKTNERNHSDAVDSNSRARPNTHHHHHRSQTSNDSSNSSSTQQQTRSEPLQAKLSNPQRILTTTSTSTVIPNRQTQHMEQQSSFDNGIKMAKTRAMRTQPAQSTEQRSSPHDEIKSSRSKKHHSHNQQQQNVMEHRNGSPAYHETIRRVDNKQGTPVMQIPISQQQQRQKQSSIPSMNITRTRI